jgi:hypothetical protein
MEKKPDLGLRRNLHASHFWEEGKTLKLSTLNQI